MILFLGQHSSDSILLAFKKVLNLFSNTPDSSLTNISHNGRVLFFSGSGSILTKTSLHFLKVVVARVILGRIMDLLQLLNKRR
jgi:hypothetical protein